MAADLELKRAILGAGGVGYFEYAADVTGQDILLYRARLDQVDDILKSIVVMDEAGPASVTLPGKASLETAFSALPFDVDDMASIPGLLSSLKGAEVTVAGPQTLVGRIVNVREEKVTDSEGRSTSRNRVSLIADGKITQFVLEEAAGITFADETLGKQVAAALDALRANQDRSSRTIAIRLAPGKERTVHVGMVMEAPVWKAAYRLSMPEKEGDKARLQGWAVLENMTGTDWKNVGITLSAASPVTFRQALYDPYYVTRPVIAPPVSRAAMPRTDVGQMEYAPTANSKVRAAAAAPQGIIAGNLPPTAIMQNRSPQAMLPQARRPTHKAALGAVADASESSESVAGSTFVLTATVDVKAGESITTPFIDTPVPAERVAWIQDLPEEGQFGRMAWHAVSLKNDGAATLPAGAVTLYEDTGSGPAFSGEAQLAVLPVGETRILGFGLDQKVTVDATVDQTNPVSEVSYASGMLLTKRSYRVETVYRIQNTSAEKRVVILEHPRHQRKARFELVDQDKLKATLTPSAYRLRVEVNAGETKTLDVVLETPQQQKMLIADISEDTLKPLIAQSGTNAAARAKLEPVIIAARALDTARKELKAVTGQREAIVNDQQRLRDNLNSAPAGSDLQRLYSGKLLEQEKTIEQLDKSIEAARKTVDAAVAELTKTVENIR
ncbi:MAG: DUF4139 domain-containing protein [Methylobacteriaceae bacterium]|jgi:hypothetical protein|nr:DUF4139 domain-containing protein [Methylobacteriaceae bacterium]